MAKRQDLLKLPIENHDNKTGVTGDFYDDRVKELVFNGATFGEIIKISKTEKWHSVLAAMPIAETLGLKNIKKTKPKKGRLTEDEKAKIIDGILAHLKKKPWSTKGDIEESMWFDSSMVGRQVNRLKKHGKIMVSGTHQKPIFAVIGEKTKPPIL